MRWHVVAAMIALATASVGIAGLAIRRSVDGEVAALERSELRASAARTATAAAFAYRVADGWSRAWVRDLIATERRNGHEVVILGADRLPVDGSPSATVRGRRARPRDRRRPRGRHRAQPAHRRRGRDPARRRRPRARRSAPRAGGHADPAGGRGRRPARAAPRHRGGAASHPPAAARDRGRPAHGARRDRGARGRLRRPARDQGARRHAGPPGRRAAAPGGAAPRDRQRPRARAPQRARRRRRPDRGAPGRRRRRRGGHARPHGPRRPPAQPPGGRRAPARRGAEAEPARAQAPGRPARRLRRARDLPCRPLRGPRDRLRVHDRLGDGGRRPRAALADRRQPALQCAALHGSRRAGPGAPRRARRPRGAAGDRLRHRHRAGAPAAHLRPLLARSGGPRPRRRGLRHRARPGAGPRAGPRRAHRGREPPGRGVALQRLPPDRVRPGAGRAAGPRAGRALLGDAPTARRCGACAARSTPRTRPTSTRS